MIILNFASITAGTYQLGDIEMFGGALYFDEIPIGFLSAAASLLLTWKIINRIEYKANRPTEILLATFASLLFVVYLLAYSSYRPFELFGLLQYIQPTLVMAWTLITTLIGCALGFLIGGIGLKRLQSASFARQEKHVAQSYYLIASFLILVFIGTLTGYAAGYISWAALGNAQEAITQSFSYLAVHPPPLVYLSGWAVAGAVIFPLRMLQSHKISKQTLSN